MSEITKLLDEKLDPSKIQKRKQNGQELSYIAGYFAENTANRIFQYKWKKELLSLDFLFKRDYEKDGKEMVEIAYKATVRVFATIDGVEVFRDGTGAGNGSSSQLFGAYELAIKEAETDAMKRALKSFGNQFGIELYEKGYSANDEYAEGVKRSVLLFEAKEALEKATTREQVTEIFKTYKGDYRKEFEKSCMEAKKRIASEVKQ